MSGRLKVSDGDWICPAKDCENLNFARREKCNKCGEPKEPSMIVKNAGTEIGQRFAEKSKGLFSANDWQCSKCGNINWARRNTCNVCNAPKVGPEEQRTGYGGGFKENENVTYKEREDDSDGEFDEFGRKKKKFRGKIPDVKTVVDEAKPKPQPVVQEEEEEEEEDDDDDDDVDLSKYALSSDSEGEGDEKPPEIPLKRPSSKSPSPSPKRKRSNSASSSSSSDSGSSSSTSRSGSRPKSRSRSHTRSRSPRRRSRSPHDRSRSPHNHR